MNTTILSWVPVIYLMAFLMYLANAVGKKEQLGLIASMMGLAGLTVHTAGLIIRWMESYAMGFGHAPLSNMYESLMFFSWTVMVLLLIIERRNERRELGVFAVPVAFLLMAYASFSPDIESRIQPLVPALKSNWLVSHVITCFLGYAAFVIASLFSIMYLLKVKRGSNAALSILPDKSTIEDLVYQCLIIGYVMFTIGIMTGSVWAHSAWGSYWSWDPKETWALITWLIYTAALHIRFTGGNRGKKVAIMSLIGLGSVLFTYLGVNYLPGLHSYL
jgi:cytochrome c-type biogenesis protein CcsB